MPVDRRGYHYKSVRDGKQVRRIYLGKGSAATTAHAQSEQRRIRAAEQAAAWNSSEAKRGAAEASLRRLEDLAGQLMRVTLLTAGYHRHDRGSWRKRRMARINQNDRQASEFGSDKLVGDATPGTMATSTLNDQGSADPALPEQWTISEQELREILDRAEKGDRTVLSALEELLDHRPSLWNHCGDVARAALLDWIELISDQSLLVRQSMIRRTTAMLIELTGPDGSLLERLLAERIVCSWLQANQADSAFAHLKGREATLAQLEAMTKRQDRTQRTFLKAVEALATVRRLGVGKIPGVRAGHVTVGRVGTGDDSRNGKKDLASAHEPQRVIQPQASANGGHKRPCDGAPNGCDSLVPEILRDRMRGLVDSEN